MNDSINHEGLTRLVGLELSRMKLTDPDEARRILKGKVGVYDMNDAAISAGITRYFALTDQTATEH